MGVSTIPAVPGHVMSRRWWAGLGLTRPGPTRPESSVFHVVGRGPTRAINVSVDGPRSGPANNILINSRLGPARPITLSNSRPDLARPGPSQFQTLTRGCERQSWKRYFPAFSLNKAIAFNDQDLTETTRANRANKSHPEGYPTGRSCINTRSINSINSTNSDDRGMLFLCQLRALTQRYRY